jgi:hypothetical protein
MKDYPSQSSSTTLCVSETQDVTTAWQILHEKVFEKSLKKRNHFKTNSAVFSVYGFCKVYVIYRFLRNEIKEQK